MRRIINALLLWFPIACSGQLSGEFQFSITNNLPLWDLSGTYSHTNGSIRSEDNLRHAPSGTITGTGSTHYNDGLNNLDATEVLRGRVSGRRTLPVQVKVTASGQFSGVALGHPVSGPFNGSLSLGLNATSRILSGTESATVCVRGRGCQTVTTNVTFELPTDVDGTWTLALNIGTTNNAVRGSAIVMLSNERFLAFKVRGRYAPIDGASRLTLNGTGAAFGRRLLVRIDFMGQLQFLRGQLFGQSLLFP